MLSRIHRQLSDGLVFTPTPLAHFLHRILMPLKPGVILDPCIGSGQMVEPWFFKATIVGIDIEYRDPPCDIYFNYDATLLTTWTHTKPDLILCNPPFNLTHEFWLMLTTLFPTTPTVLIAPINFRCTQAKRRALYPKGPQISSIVSLPTNVFPDTRYFTEVLIYNAKGLHPHYWYQ